MAIKEPENEQQALFFKYLVEGATEENGKFKFRTPKEAAELAGYSGVEYAYTLIRQYKEYYLDRLYGKMVLHAPEAIQNIINAMRYDGKDIGVKERTIAAQDLLDRAGLIKKERLEITTDGSAGVFVLPAKEKESNVDDSEG